MQFRVNEMVTFSSDVMVTGSSCCTESQREAALLLGQFAATDSDCKVTYYTYIHSRFFISLCMCLSVFFLSEKLQLSHSHMKGQYLQVHIVQRGAVRPLVEMLQSQDTQLKEMAAFALGRLAQVNYLSYYQKHCTPTKNIFTATYMHAEREGGIYIVHFDLLIIQLFGQKLIYCSVLKKSFICK